MSFSFHCPYSYERWSIIVYVCTYTKCTLFCIVLRYGGALYLFLNRISSVRTYNPRQFSKITDRRGRQTSKTLTKAHIMLSLTKHTYTRQYFTLRSLTKLHNFNKSRGVFIFFNSMHQIHNNLIRNTGLGYVLEITYWL